GPAAITGDATGYRLDPSAVDLDILRFVELLAEGRAHVASGEFTAAEPLLTDALALWRGAPYPEWHEPPSVRGVAAHLEELRLGGTEDLAETLAGLQRHQQALGYLQGLVDAHPTREHAWALLAESHLALGERRRARMALDSARRALAEHGVDLGSELRAVRDLLHSSLAVPSPRTAEPTGAGDGLVGREAVLAQARTAVEAALATSEPVAVVVAGEPGIGKTALLEHIGTAITGRGGRSPAVARVACDRRLTTPYASFDALLRQFGDVDPDSAAIEALTGGKAAVSSDRHGLAAEVATFLERIATATDGLVLLLEDLHWASAEVLETVLELLARHRPVPLALVASLRDTADITEPGSDRQALLTELRRRARPFIPLQGLDEAAIEQMLGVDTTQARTAQRLTGGNPLYLQHLTRSPDGDFVSSGSLDEALDETIDSIPVEVLTVLETAAAIGTSFDDRVLTSAAAHPPLGIDAATVAEALQIARQARLMAARDDAEPHTVSFTHILVRDRLYHRTPVRDRRQAHALILRALVRRPGRERPTPDLLAHHAREGWPLCPTSEAVGRLLTAGEAANRHLGFAHAERLFREALDIVAMDPAFDEPATLATLLAASGAAATAAGNLNAARQSFTELVELGDLTADPVASLRGALGMVRTYANASLDWPVLEQLTRALEDAVTVADPPLDLLAEALAALFIYRPDAASELRDRIAVVAPAQRTALYARTWDLEPVDQALIVARTLDEAPDADRLSSRVRRWASEVAAGERDLLTPPGPIWSLEGEPLAHWEADCWQITTTMATGDFGRALRLLDAMQARLGEARDGGTDIGLGATDAAMQAAAALGQRSWIAMQRGDWPTLAQLAERNKPTYTLRRPLQRMVGALSQVMLGNGAQAWEAVDALLDDLDAGRLPASRLLATLVALGNASLWLGHDRGMTTVRAALESVRGQHVLFYVLQYWGATEHQLGKLAACLGDLDVAVEDLRAGLAAHERSGARPLQVQSQRYLASVLWHRGSKGDRAEAADLRHQVVDAATALGMAGIAASPWPPPAPIDGP
ncbi:BTAD domain-containing putative transcriptional regulator, partial [Nocardioides sp.]|uniref:BTAD domain-containing putative transcriptional regulator n=1 Tax=Nocardioides sp. TaxID=35761 RepID=UPI002BD0FC56